MSAPPFDQSALEQYLERRHGSAVSIEEVRELGGETRGPDALKQFGYGRPLLVTYEAGGERRREVLHSIRRNPFGRERDDDRVAAVWLDFQTFNELPRHVPAVDMVGIGENGELGSLQDVRELLLVTSYRPGELYANDLLHLRDGGKVSQRDFDRVEALAVYLAQIHSRRFDGDDEERQGALWRRRLRDLVGHGEGIMGLSDSYPLPLPYVSAGDLEAIEALANGWRWRLKPLQHRLRQVHGDFHPFNILFDADGDLHILDRSRGAWGEPADDVSCLTINYLFFSLQRSGGLNAPFADLYRRFWETYLAQRPDDGLGDVIQPWFAWRALVLASPIWYPDIDESVRRTMLAFARRVLSTDHFDWRAINAYLELIV